MIAIAPFTHMGLHLVCIGDGVRCADDGDEAVNQVFR